MTMLGDPTKWLAGFGLAATTIPGGGPETRSTGGSAIGAPGN